MDFESLRDVYDAKTDVMRAIFACDRACGEEEACGEEAG